MYLSISTTKSLIENLNKKTNLLKNIIDKFLFKALFNIILNFYILDNNINKKQFKKTKILVRELKKNLLVYLAC